jgi:hypothetical protein
MTVPATAEDAHHTKHTILRGEEGEKGEEEEEEEEEDGRTSEASSAASPSLAAKPSPKISVPKTSVKGDSSKKGGSKMTSVMAPLSGKAGGDKGDKSKAVSYMSSSSLKSLSHHRQQWRVHSSFYERMAAQALAAASLSSAMALAEASTAATTDQPLDLSKKPSRPRSGSEPDPPSRKTDGGGRGGGKEGGGGGMSNGISSLESLQKRFGGDFLMESPRRPSSIIPLQSSILPSKALLRPPYLPGNGLSPHSISVAAAAAAAAVSGGQYRHMQPSHLAHLTSLGAKAKTTASGNVKY